MNHRDLLPRLIPVALVAVLAAVAAFLPAQQPAQPQAQAVPGRASVACPDFASATASSVTAIAPGEMLTVHGVSDSTPSLMAGAIGVVRNNTATRVSGPTDTPFSGTSMSTAASGPFRGLSLTECRAPATQAWLTGVVSSDSVLTDLVLINLDNGDAAVDLTFYGDNGEVTAVGGRGILVGANAQRAISLKPLITQPTPMTVHVETSQGRVAAFARETMWQGNNPVGTSWITPAATGTDVVVPGVPDGDGTRQLVVANPSERGITADITALTANGPVSLAGAAQIDVPARSTRSVSLETGLASAAAAVHVRADTEITASVRTTTGASGPTSDVTVSSSAAALPETAVIPVPPGSKGTASVILSADRDHDASVRLSFADELGTKLGDDIDVSLVAGSSAPVPVPRAPVVAITIESSVGTVWGSVVVRATLGRVQGVGVVSYPGHGEGESPTVMQNPHVGEAA